MPPKTAAIVRKNTAAVRSVAARVDRGGAQERKRRQEDREVPRAAGPNRGSSLLRHRHARPREDEGKDHPRHGEQGEAGEQSVLHRLHIPRSTDSAVRRAIRTLTFRRNGPPLFPLPRRRRRAAGGR